MDRLLSRIADRNDIIRINTLEWVLIIEDRKLVLNYRIVYIA